MPLENGMRRPGPGQVLVWRAFLGRPQSTLDALRELLDDSERARAASMDSERSRTRFVASHGVLRSILGACLGEEPAKLTFSRTCLGKPCLADPWAAGGLRFSMAHSEDAALYAVAGGREVGVDVEKVRHDLDATAMADRFFTKAEAAAVRKAPDGERPDTFLRLWTLKEAWSKAVGCGFSVPPDRFAVPPSPPTTPWTARADFGPGQARTWVLRLLDAPAGYVAGLAVEGRGCEVQCLDWG